MNDYVIMVLGLGRGQSKEISRIPFYWRKLGIDGEIYRMAWGSSEPYESRFKGLLGRIDEAKKSGKRVSLIGISAGGSTAVNAYVQRKEAIHKVVFICGRLGGIELINPRYYQRYPVFMGSINHLPRSLKLLDEKDKAKMLTMYGLYDSLVPRFTSRIAGVKEKKILSIGHAVNCLVGLTFYAPSISKFIKSS